MAEYRCVATSEKGFMRQLVQYLRHGYWFYVTGTVKPGREPESVDETLLSKYGISISRQARWRRKRRGLANVHYLRFEDYWILLATKGHHEFYREHMKRHEKTGEVLAKYFRCAKKDPIHFAGYSVTVKRGKYRPHRLKLDPAGPPEPDDSYRVRVQIAQTTYRNLTAEYLQMAQSRRFTAEVLERMVYGLPYEPYAPVRQQLLNLVRRMNKVRRERGIAELLVAKQAVRFYMEPVSAFAARASSAIATTMIVAAGKMTDEHGQ